VKCSDTHRIETLDVESEGRRVLIEMGLLIIWGLVGWLSHAFVSKSTGGRGFEGEVRVLIPREQKQGEGGRVGHFVNKQSQQQQRVVVVGCRLITMSDLM